MDRISPRFSEYSAGNLLMTDDSAPVELLGMKVIDDIISDEVSYYKAMYDAEGIEGLKNALGF